MKGIAKFYTYFWIIYFPVCIAFTAIVDFDYSDELLTVALLAYAVLKAKYLIKSRKRNREIQSFVVIMAFYLLYSMMIHVTTQKGVLLDFLQQLRPYMVFYTTWVMAPQFNTKQKRLIKCVMLGSFTIYTVLYIVNPELVNPYGIVNGSAESAAMGQLALCCAMIFYLFSKKTNKNRGIAIFIMLLGLLCGKSKYFGECVAFIALILYVNDYIKFKSAKTVGSVVLLGIVIVFFTWTKFNMYYVEGMRDTGAEMKARPASYKVARQIIFEDYIPFGSGLGSFGTAAAAKEYSPLYYKYKLNHIWGLTPENPMFLADAFYPTLAEVGIVGIFFLLVFWKRRLTEMQKIPNLACYRMALMCFLALALESTADSSYLSGKGMGYFMILAVCLNSAVYPFEENTKGTQVNAVSNR